MEQQFQDWVGRSVTRSDLVTPRLLAEYRATLSPFLRDPVLGPDAEYVTGVHAIDPLIGHAPMPAHMDAGPGEERFIEGAVTAATAGSTITLRLDATTLGDPGTIFLFLVTGREASEGGGTDSDVLPDQATGSTTVIAIPWAFREAARGR